MSLSPYLIPGNGCLDLQQLRSQHHHHYHRSNHDPPFKAKTWQGPTAGIYDRDQARNHYQYYGPSQFPPSVFATGPDNQPEPEGIREQVGREAELAWWMLASRVA